jgi:hypothetical protein
MPLDDWALCVGINGYPAVGCLEGAEADAEEFHDWVTSAGGVKPERARLIKSRLPASGRARDALPTRREIEEFFDDVDDAANENERLGEGLVAGRRLYLFFSGHGFAPSLDASALLTANATPSAIHNIGCRLWADHIFQGGWFKEVVLFQDTCRSRLLAGTLMPPYLRKRNAPGKARFYAQAALNDTVALERPDGRGGKRGVFSMTLMDGLNGYARDPVSRAITSESLRAYLQSNMKYKYAPADLERDDISREPEVFNPTPFEILPPGPVESFPVRVCLPAAANTARIFAYSFEPIMTSTGVNPWEFSLRVGNYEVSIDNGPSRNFQVTGAIELNGSKRVVNVEF